MRITSSPNSSKATPSATPISPRRRAIEAAIQIAAVHAAGIAQRTNPIVFSPCGKRFLATLTRTNLDIVILGGF